MVKVYAENCGLKANEYKASYRLFQRLCVCGMEKLTFRDWHIF